MNRTFISSVGIVSQRGPVQKNIALQDFSPGTLKVEKQVIFPNLFKDVSFVDYYLDQDKYMSNRIKPLKRCNREKTIFCSSSEHGGESCYFLSDEALVFKNSSVECSLSWEGAMLAPVAREDEMPTAFISRHNMSEQPLWIGKLFHHLINLCQTKLDAFSQVLDGT